MTPTHSTIARSRLDGEFLLAGDSGYDEARTVWNAMVDHHPQIIIRCASVADVVAAVRMGRELVSSLGVRCGGHSPIGLAVPDGGLMIDLTPMGSVRVDPARRLAWVQGGALLGALDRATQAHSLATTAGNVSHTGVGGLTLGGGMGWLARQHGLACDNVVSFQVVTAEGRVVRASEDENTDLFWGLRGGGGNFGIVTEFVFRLHDTGTETLVADYSFAIEDAAPVLRGWRDLQTEAPRQATFTASVGGDGLAVVGMVWIGDPETGRLLLPAFESLGRPVRAAVSQPSYLELQTRDDTVGGHAWRRYSKGHYLKSFSDEAIDAFLRRGSADGGGDHLPGVGLQAYGGAIGDVADDVTAFSHRDTLFEWGGGVRWTDPAEDDDRLAAARAAGAAMAPYADGVYVNSIGDEGAAGVRRAYSPDKLARLRALKTVYDPSNVFHLNANISPDAR